VDQNLTMGKHMSSSIVLQLQQDSLDQHTAVADLLRKALVVSKKLGVREFEHWIEHELNGYPEDAEIPGYRTVRGEVKAFNPFRGWVPVHFGDPELAEILSERQSNQSLPELEDMLRGSGEFIMPFPPDAENKFMKAMRLPMRPMLFVHRPSLVGILNSVRNTILNWSIRLEQDGILGEGLSFTQKEVQAATGTSHNVNNFFGPIGTSNVLQGSPHATQVNVSVEFDISAVRQFVERLRGALPDLNLKGDKSVELEAELRTVESQISSPRPKSSILRESLRTVRSILEGAAGGAAGQMLLELLKSFRL